MCGIAGIVGEQLQVRQQLPNMLRKLRHRGPDDRGEFYSTGDVAALGQQRLAILDLSPLGHQPMFSSNGRFVIVFNGEVYNFRQLRSDLLQSGVPLKSQSDTEVILELYARDGAACVQQLDGMFAFAIWDSVERSLFCARDPLGIKPFYYWQAGQKLAFASELRSLLEANLGARRLSAVGLESYLLYGAVQEPNTLVEGVFCLAPGHTLLWKNGQIKTESFWRLHYPEVPNSDGISYPTALKSVRDALDDSVARHFVSDVPVGIFLSGGTDSTALLAMAHAQGVANLQTFCIGFEQPEYDEGGVAAQTAAHFKANHHQWRMTPQEGKELFNDFLIALDQPSNDGFNTFCVSTFARRSGLKVVLSGVGGDELFGGYPSFKLVPKLLQLHKRLGWLGPVRTPLLQATSPLLRSLRYQRLATFLGSTGTATAAHWAVRGFFLPHEVVRLLAVYGCNSDVSAPFVDPAMPSSVVDKVAMLETVRYMRNQLLRDSDVMSMSVGLELRTPLVDRKLWDVVTNLPSALRLQAGKKLLTDAVPEIPAWILGAPKRGFRFPFEQWVSGPWAEMFANLESQVGMPLKTWSRKWSLFVLNHFIGSNKISC